MLPPRLAQLVFYPFTSASRAVFLLLKELRIPCTFIKRESGFGQIEPRLVPLIEPLPPSSYPVFVDKNNVIFGVTSILRYLVQSTPTAPSHLYPAELTLRIHTDMYLEWHVGTLFTLTSRVLYLTTDFDGNTCTAPSIQASSRITSSDLSALADVMKQYLEALNHLDTSFLAHAPFLGGEDLSIADVLAAVDIAMSSVFDIDLTSYPRLQQWYQRVQERLSAHWLVQVDDFARFEEAVRDRTQKKRAHQEKIKKHGKDAAGGNRAPDICHTVLFHRTLESTFNRFTSSPVLKEWTRSTCHVLPRSGGTVTFYDQRFMGTLLFMEQNKKVLISWRQADWEPGKFSTVKMMFEQMEGNNTQLTLEQSDVPEGLVKKTDLLWNQLFWKPSGGVLVRHILQQLFFDGLSPHDVYEMLTDSAKCSRLTNKRCEVNRGVGAEFSLLDGLVVGTTLELVIDVKIVQIRRHTDWPPEHFSKLTIKIERVAGGTAVIHTQRNVPVEHYRTVMETWDRYFWKKMQHVTMER